MKNRIIGYLCGGGKDSDTYMYKKINETQEEYDTRMNRVFATVKTQATKEELELAASVLALDVD